MEKKENLCSVLCEMYILQRRFIRFDKAELIALARERNWLREEGVPLHAIGQILSYMGLIISRKKDEWKNEGNNIYSTSFMPRETGEVSLSLKEKGSNYWNNVVKYDIEQPTKSDWKNVEEHYPLSLPEMKNVKNLDEEKWNSVGIDDHQLLKHIREGNIKELPIIYNGKGQRFTIISFPMNKYLKAGQSYTFSFRPQAGIHWALVNNNQ